MTHKSIGFHTRLCVDDSKVVGGSFGGGIDVETVERLVKHHFDVVVRPSGDMVFVDDKGREVRVYLAVRPEMTSKGIQAKKDWLKKIGDEKRLSEERAESQAEELVDAMCGLTHEEVIKRLKGEL